MTFWEWADKNTNDIFLFVVMFLAAGSLALSCVWETFHEWLLKDPKERKQ